MALRPSNTGQFSPLEMNALDHMDAEHIAGGLVVATISVCVGVLCELEGDPRFAEVLADPDVAEKLGITDDGSETIKSLRARLGL